jgi:hypothetical protein
VKARPGALVVTHVVLERIYNRRHTITPIMLKGASIAMTIAPHDLQTGRTPDASPASTSTDRTSGARCSSLEDAHLVVEARPGAEKRRWLMTGQVDGRHASTIVTRRGDAIRVISMRRSRNEERRRHEAIFG